MPRKDKKVIENPIDTYRNNPGYEDPLKYMTPEQIVLLCEYCEYYEYLNAAERKDYSLSNSIFAVKHTKGLCDTPP